MKRRQLIKRLELVAAHHHAEWVLRREGGRHTIYQMNDHLISGPPSHRDRRTPRKDHHPPSHLCCQERLNVDTLSATVQRDGRFWYIDVDGVGVTQARHLREVEPMVRDLVASLHGLDPDSFEVEVTIVLDEEVQNHLGAAEQLRAEAAQAQARATAEQRAAAQALRDQGLALRDIGAALHMSHQRVHQLIN